VSHSLRLFLLFLLSSTHAAGTFLTPYPALECMTDYFTNVVALPCSCSLPPWVRHLGEQCLHPLQLRLVPSGW
jgi:hypothetical protein